MEIKTFFDNRTYTLTYVVYDPQTKDAVVIDPVLDYDPSASKTWSESVDKVIDFVKQNGLKMRYVLETHAHADHLSGSQLVKDACPRVKVAIGSRIQEVQALFKGIFDLPEEFPVNGSQFDRLLQDGESFSAGSIDIEVFNTPGHTPACVTFKIDDVIFTGDLLFMPDSGTGRCDFPGGSAADMYRAIKDKIYTLPEETRVFVGHDYQPGGREVASESTVGDNKKGNIALAGDTTEKAFVEFREKRDASLAAPKLLFQSVQVNVDAGHLPPRAENEVRYLKIPINVFRPKNQVEPGDLDYIEAARKKLDCQ